MFPTLSGTPSRALALRPRASGTCACGSARASASRFFGSFASPKPVSGGVAKGGPGVELLRMGVPSTRAFIPSTHKVVVPDGRELICYGDR